jgi:hypothetical protein
MGTRCNAGIHDYKIAYDDDEHIMVDLKEFPDKNIKSNVHVDWRLRSRILEINNGGPFNSHTSTLLNSSFDAFSRVICNESDAVKKRGALTKHQRLDIALAFDEGRNKVFGGKAFTYKANHTVYGQLCMIVQTKYFTTSLATGHVEEIFTVNNSNKGIITVREIAFGQEVSYKNDSPTPRPALWFDIPKDSVESCTEEDTKLLRRQANLDRKNGRRKMSFFESHLERLNKQTAFVDIGKQPLFEAPFYIYYVNKSYCGMNRFITDILRFKVSEGNGEDAIFASKKKQKLEKSFIAIKRALKRDSWPSNVGSVDDSLTPSCHSIRHVMSEYKVPKEDNKYGLWESFVEITNSTAENEYSGCRERRLRAMPRLLSDEDLLVEK